MEFLGPPWCRGCVTPFEFDRGDDAYCASCIANRPGHDGIRAAVRNDDLSAQVALWLKNAGKIGLARVIAQQLLRHLPDDRDNIDHASSFALDADLVAQFQPVRAHWQTAS